MNLGLVKSQIPVQCLHQIRILKPHLKSWDCSFFPPFFFKKLRNSFITLDNCLQNISFRHVQTFKNKNQIDMKSENVLKSSKMIS